MTGRASVNQGHLHARQRNLQLQRGGGEALVSVAVRAGMRYRLLLPA